MPEYRHIKVQGALYRDAKGKVIPGHVLVTILEQTHTSHEFGLNEGNHTWKYGSRGFVHGGVRLYSDTHGPCAGVVEPHGEDKKVTLWFNVINGGQKEASMRLTNNQWLEFRAAVEAYNDYFKGD